MHNDEYTLQKGPPTSTGGTIAVLIGTIASIHWDKGALRDFRMEVNQEFAKLWADNERHWAATQKLLDSHLELRANLQAINDTLKKTQKVQEDCAALQAARLNLVKKDKKGDKILCSPCVWSNSLNSMVKLNRPLTASMKSRWYLSTAHSTVENLTSACFTFSSSKSTFYCQAIEPFADLKIGY